jgi:hypothetical protein
MFCIYYVCLFGGVSFELFWKDSVSFKSKVHRIILDGDRCDQAPSTILAKIYDLVKTSVAVNKVCQLAA